MTLYRVYLYQATMRSLFMGFDEKYVILKTKKK